MQDEGGHTGEDWEKLKADADLAHEEFDIVHYIIGSALVFFVMWMAGIIGGEKKVSPPETECRNQPGKVHDGLTLEKERHLSRSGPTDQDSPLSVLFSDNRKSVRQ